jgi:gamma-glutamyltranspeptidase/glutathione hydrolase
MTSLVLDGARVRAEDPPWIVRGKNGMVATESEQASQAGLEMLKAGGNAIDAAVASSFALAVTRPWHTGLGGGAFLLARFADGNVVVQDSRETAPAAATPDMFAAGNKESDPPPSVIGHRAVAVPGMVAGRCEVLADHGTMPLPKVLGPAIRLAEEGWPVDEPYVAATRSILSEFERHPQLKQTCKYVWQTHLREGDPRKPGEVLKQPELGKLLRGIAEHGPDFFYRGPVADAIAAEMKAHGGLITKEDLASYRPKSRPPLIATYRGYKLLLMPPPSSGGVAIAETLNILEVIDHANIAQQQALLALHYQVEAMKHAFADRATWLGDPDYAAIPTDRLIGKDLAVQLAGFVRGRTGEIVRYGASQLPDDAGTSHLCVADRSGNVVVTTETINTEFGSLAAVGEWGLILNNEMDDFTTRPGVPNAFGLVQGRPNTIAPGKRPLSSMSPTIVLRDDQPYLLLGAAGGPRIISAVLRVFLSVVDAELPLELAVARARVHHQWRPNEIFFDQSPPPDEIVEALRNHGHKISDRKKSSVVQVIQRDDEGWIGAADPRGGGKPAGY